MSQSRSKVVKAIAALAWSDGYLDEEERDKLRRLGEKMGLDDRERFDLKGYLEVAPSLDGISFDELEEKERQAMYLLALHYAYLDGLVWSGEQRVLDTLASLLRLSPEVRASLEKKYREGLGR
jgi:uncharacterized membrane protein YebE (DUF533 family)